MKDEGGVQNNLKAIRTRIGLSQANLALASGVTRQTISGIEQGLYTPSTAVALRLARALGCRIEDMFRLEDELPAIPATYAGRIPARDDMRVTLAQVAGQWVAHPLFAQEAFRTEMLPCDGIGRRNPASGLWQVAPLNDPAAFTQTVALAGCTPVLSLWARAAERWYPGLRVHWHFANSLAALQSLVRGEVHIAGLHAADPATHEYNIPFVRQHAPHRTVVLINLGVWEEGLLVSPGNPKAIRSVTDLAQPGVQLINREIGAGSRMLLDMMLLKERVPCEAVPGYGTIALSHLKVAEAVVAGQADVGVSSACVAATFGLDFIPLQEARYDLAVLKEYLDIESVRQLLSTLDHRTVRPQFSVLGGYNTDHTGEVVAEVSLAHAV